MMYFFKTLACFYLLKVQVLHMALYIKVERGFTFSIKRTLSKKWPVPEFFLLWRAYYQRFIIMMTAKRLLTTFSSGTFFLCFRRFLLFFRLHGPSQVPQLLCPVAQLKKGIQVTTICYLWTGFHWKKNAHMDFKSHDYERMWSVSSKCFSQQRPLML